jgi:SAM-dependent methyltransferase
MSNEARPAEPLAQTYDPAFYDALAGEVRSSAEVIVPLVIELVDPASVLDVGCGTGSWLAAFQRAGVATIVGVDGPHVDSQQLEIPQESFVVHDLRQPLDLGQRFDLVVSLEVAEHLDAPLARGFVSSLVSHAPIVLFSAAIPHQSGAGHVNEQWPSYWAEHFAAHGYVAVDLVRQAVWQDPRVAFWYAQNTVLYVDPSTEQAHSILKTTAAIGTPRDLVHPAQYLRVIVRRTARAPIGLRSALREVGAATSRAARSRMDRLSARRRGSTQ